MAVRIARRPLLLLVVVVLMSSLLLLFLLPLLLHRLDGSHRRGRACTEHWTGVIPFAMVGVGVIPFAMVGVTSRDERVVRNGM